MAGTNSSIAKAEGKTPLAPAIILVRPQLGQNIGMCARAMLNCGVTELRLVKPRDGWPSETAGAAGAGADDVLNNAKLFETTADAVKDLEFVLATTARNRGMVKEIYTAEAGTALIHQRNAGGVQKCGIMFGPERTGLENDDVALADAILNIPLNPGFSSLNLAQAVLLVSYSWLNNDNPFKEELYAESDITKFLGDSAPATKDEIGNLMTQLLGALDTSGFFRSPEQKPTISRNISNFFHRAGMTAQDVRTLHGVFASLIGKRRRGTGEE